MGLYLMETNKEDTWKKILHIIITILTAIAASLTTQSCIKHKNAPTRVPIPVVTLASQPNQFALANLPETSPAVVFNLTGFTQEEVTLLRQLLEHERDCTMLHATDTDLPPAR